MVPSTDINPGTDCVSEPSAVSERSSLDPVLSQTMATRASPVQNTLANSQDLQLSSQPGAQHEKAGLARVKGASSCCSCDFHSLLNPGREWDTSVSNHCSLCQQEREREELNQLYFMGLSKTDQDRYLSTYCCEEDSLWFGLTEIPDWEDDEERELVISRSALPKGSLLFEQVLGEVAPEVRDLEQMYLRKLLTNGNSDISKDWEKFELMLSMIVYQKYASVYISFTLVFILSAIMCCWKVNRNTSGS